MHYFMQIAHTNRMTPSSSISYSLMITQYAQEAVILWL